MCPPHPSLSLSGKAGNKWDLRWLSPAEYSGREVDGEVVEHDRGGRWSGQRQEGRLLDFGPGHLREAQILEVKAGWW